MITLLHEDIWQLIVAEWLESQKDMLALDTAAVNVEFRKKYLRSIQLLSKSKSNLLCNIKAEEVWNKYVAWKELRTMYFSRFILSPAVASSIQNWTDYRNLRFLKVVELANKEISLPIDDILAASPHLEELQLENMKITCSKYSSEVKVPLLRKLTLFHHHTSLPEEKSLNLVKFYEWLSGVCPNLTSLDLVCEVNNLSPVIYLVPVLHTFRSLEVLGFFYTADSCAFDPIAIRTSTPFSIVELYLRCHAPFPGLTAAYATIASNCPHMQRISTSLGMLSRLQDQKYLLTSAMASNWSNLTHVHLVHVDDDDVLASLLTNLSCTCSKLRYFHLEHIDARFASLLTHVSSSFPALTSLNFTNCTYLTDDIMRAFCEHEETAVNLPLETISILKCSQITHQTFAFLLQTFTYLKHIHFSVDDAHENNNQPCSIVSILDRLFNARYGGEHLETIKLRGRVIPTEKIVNDTNIVYRWKCDLPQLQKIGLYSLPISPSVQSILGGYLLCKCPKLRQFYLTRSSFDEYGRRLESSSRSLAFTM